jgi:hypothetical protein
MTTSHFLTFRLGLVVWLDLCQQLLKIDSKG